MSGARVIRLSAPSSMPQAVSFEEAFGEFSNAQGRGRERRKTRRLDRIENRTEVRSARQEGRGERKLARQEKVASRNLLRGERTAGREELQMARKGKRLAKRETGLESRLARREARTSSRVGRRDLRNPQAVPSTESAGYEPGVGSLTPGDAGSQVPASTASAGYAQTEAPGTQSGGYAPGTQSGYYEDEETPTGTASGYYEPQGTSSGYYSENEDVYDQGLVDETAQGAYDLGYQDAQEDAGLDVEITGDEDYGDFDGVMGAEDRYNELQDKNDMPVNPQVQNLADKCVWNQMLIAKLKNDRKNAQGNPQEMSKAILQRAKRLKDLQDELESYANNLGAYSSLDNSPELLVTRKRAVQMAMNKARRKAAGQAPVSLTAVNRTLKPQISRERIVVPSSETMSSATGITALDNSADYDAPDTREFFIAADGSFTKGIDLGSIALGALITVSFIYLNNKYKWIKM
jgi:hypothetical protein